MSQLIDDIKKKKELSDISDKFVREELRNYLKRNFKAKKFLASEFSPRSAYYKKIIKDVRTQLRRSYGLFRRKGKVIKEFNKTANSKETITEILKSHSSTRERLEFYSEIYRKIFKITKDPKMILDFGCGLNPFSYSYMRLPHLTYFAYDLATDEIKLINDYFKKSKIKGRAYALNVLQTNQIKKLPQADIAFLFKMTDVLDKGKNHKNTEEVLKAIPARFVVVSFPTVTMSGRKMNFPRRKWIELLCERLKYELNYFEVGNELFYVIGKEKKLFPKFVNKGGKTSLREKLIEKIKRNKENKTKKIRKKQ
tara:strand:- start:328 stop:1257 length:930 start_codon:yes stop_codon:yes gene_type:complete